MLPLLSCILNSLISYEFISAKEVTLLCMNNQPTNHRWLVVLAEEGLILLMLSWQVMDFSINGIAITERHKSSMVKINLPLYCRILLRHHLTFSFLVCV